MLEYQTENDISHPVLSNLIRLRDNSTYDFTYNPILQVPQVRTMFRNQDITIFYRYHRFEQQSFGRRVSGMLQQFYGTVSHMNLDR